MSHHGESRFLRWSFVWGLGLLICLPSWGQDATPSAQSLMKDFAQAIRQTEQFSVQVHAHQVQQTGMTKRTDDATYAFTVRRPNQFNLEGVAGQVLLHAGANDKTASIYLPVLNEVVQMATGGQLAQLMTTNNDLADNIDLAVPMARLLLTGQWPETQETAYVGPVEIDGNKGHEIKLTVGFDRYVALQVIPQPRLLRVRDDLGKIVQRMMGPKADNSKVERVWTYSDWNFDSLADTKSFTIQLPENVQRVAYLGQQSNQENHGLLGKSAPDFALKTLDGKTVKLAELRGKKVVVLDFWAIRCPPCRTALPVLAETSRKYADQGLALYAVNIEDNKARIANYLKEQKLTIPVLIGSDSDVANQYQVRSIPQSVIIGKDGRVQSVHLGFTSEIGRHLDAEVQTLLDDVDLLPQKSAPYDLVVKGVHFSPEPANLGAPLHVTVDIENTADTVARAGTYRVALIVDGNEAFFGRGPVDIAPQSTAKIDLANEMQLEFVKPGAATVACYLVPAAQSFERNMQNNVWQGSLEVAAETADSGK